MSNINCGKRLGADIPPQICRSYVIAFLGIVVTFLAMPTEGKISGLSSKAMTFGVIARDFNLHRADLESSAVILPPGRGRRLRRSAMTKELIEFRKFLYKLRQLRRGAKVSSPGQTRRDLLFDKNTMGNAISKDIKCGQCRLKKEWIPISKPGCRTNFVLAPVCTGMCETWEIPDINPPYVTKHHRVCRPMQIEYRMINLQRCKPGVNTQHVIPIARSCACLKCKSSNTACRML